MASSKTHPHIDRPSEAQLAEVIKGKPAAIRRVYLDTHRLVRKTLADVAYTVDCKDGVIGYGALQYGYDGWGMAALAPHANWVSLGFIRGTSLDDPDHLLEGTGQTVRHMKIRAPEELVASRTAIQRFLTAAAGLGRGASRKKRR